MSLIMCRYECLSRDIQLLNGLKSVKIPTKIM